MFSFVLIVVPASTSLTVMTTQDGRKILVVSRLGIRLWGQAAIDLARLHKAGMDAVLTGYLRPVTTRQGGTFPAVTITSVRPVEQEETRPTDDLEAMLGDGMPRATPKRKKSLAEAIGK